MIMLYNLMNPQTFVKCPNYWPMFGMCGKGITEDFLFHKELKTTTKSDDIFKMLDDFMTSAEISWTNCTGVCTDGAAAMTRKHDVAPHTIWVHCFLHQEAPSGKDIEPDVLSVLNTDEYSTAFSAALKVVVPFETRFSAMA
ncbi:SCND3 protein, partial [Polyodon spathula]|nr:SCND3 protein [Polyodon spathula]